MVAHDEHGIPAQSSISPLPLGLAIHSPPSLRVVSYLCFLLLCDGRGFDMPRRSGGSTALDGGRMPRGGNWPTTGAARAESRSRSDRLQRHLSRTLMGIWRAMLRSSSIDLRLVGLRVHFLVPRRLRVGFRCRQVDGIQTAANSRHTKSHRPARRTRIAVRHRVTPHASLHRVYSTAVEHRYRPPSKPHAFRRSPRRSVTPTNHRYPQAPRRAPSKRLVAPNKQTTPP